MTTPSLLLPNTRTESEAREDIARKDRQGWYGADDYVIRQIGGREIAHFDRRDVRDFVIAAAHSHDAMVEAIQFVLDHIADKERGPRDLYPAFGLDSGRAIEMCRAALALAKAKP